MLKYLDHPRIIQDTYLMLSPFISLLETNMFIAIEFDMDQITYNLKYVECQLTWLRYFGGQFLSIPNLEILLRDNVLFLVEVSFSRAAFRFYFWLNMISDIAKSHPE